MGAIPPPNPSLMGNGSTVGFRPNLDRFGMPRDYETYLWATYGAGSRIPPERRAFLYYSGDGVLAFGQQMAMR